MTVEEKMQPIFCFNVRYYVLEAQLLYNLILLAL